MFFDNTIMIFLKLDFYDKQQICYLVLIQK